MSDGALTASPASELVGREQERARIDGFLASASGGPSALTIIGEPGIGKSALWRHTIAQARSRGFRVLVSRAGEEEMPLSGVALADLFEAEDLTGAFGPSEGVFATGREVLSALRSAAEHATTVLAIDDVHWLDPFSARALRFALRRLDVEPVAVIATLRRDADRGDPLALTPTLLPERQHIVELGPLGIDDIRRAIGATVPSISRPMLRRIYEVSGGNPLYALELSRSVGANRGSGSLTGSLPMPDSLQRAIGDRIEAHAGALVPMLEIVAGLGRTSVRELRDGLVDEPDPLLAIALDEGLLVVEDDLSVRFAHPMIRSVVYTRMGPLARRDLHTRLGELAHDPDVRARHLALSADEPDPAIAASLEDAAARASHRGASDLATEFNAHSLRLTPPGDAASRRRRALQHIDLLAAAGEAGQALALADELIETWPHGPDRAAALVRRFKVEDDDLSFGERLLEEALADAGSDDALRGRVLDMLAWLRGMLRGDLEGGIRCASEGVAIARRIGDRGLAMLSLSSQALMETLGGHPRDDLLDEAVMLERELGSLGTSEGPLALVGKIRFWAGDLGGASECFAEAAEAGAREGNELTRPYRLYDLSLLECASGNLVQAGEVVRLGIEAAEDAHFPPGSLRYPDALISMWLGDGHEARRSAGLLREWAQPRGEGTAVIRSLMVEGLVALSEGSPTDAAPSLFEAVRMLEEIGIAEPGAFPALPDAIEAAAKIGERERADELLGRLEAQSDAVDTPWSRAAVDRSRGVILAAGSHPDEGATLLERAAAAFEGLGFRPEAARVVLLHGQALLRGGHRTAAGDAFADARRRFASMGARTWEARAGEELERSAPGRVTGTLTATERRIADLVAEGLMNRQIAEAMFVSVATVEAHLTRIYRKLEIRSRAELTRLVAEGDLLDERAEQG